MKTILLPLLLGFGLLLAITLRGQELSTAPLETLFVLPPAGDTLPTIMMKFEPAYVLLCLLVPGTALFAGGHSYQIKGRKYFLASAVEPYFDLNGSELTADLYGKHRRNRTIWYVTTALGQVVATVGFFQRLSLFYFIPVYDSSNNNYLLWAGGLTLGGLAARIVCFRQMRKAVELYNYQCAGKKPAVSLHLGLPSSTPAGLGLYVKF